MDAREREKNNCAKRLNLSVLLGREGRPFMWFFGGVKITIKGGRWFFTIFQVETIFGRHVGKIGKMAVAKKRKCLFISEPYHRGGFDWTDWFIFRSRGNSLCELMKRLFLPFISEFLSSMFHVDNGVSKLDLLLSLVFSILESILFLSLVLCIPVKLKFW